LNILLFIPGFLLGIVFHEAAHAWMANKLGDPTARMLGRLSLNPMKHIDPMGTVLMPLMQNGFRVRSPDPDHRGKF
jgi:Zn-dependent protease